MLSEVKPQIFCSDLDSCAVVPSTIKKILVPFDDSSFSERAFSFALDLAHHYGATITTLTIMFRNSDGALAIKHETTFDKSRLNKLEKKLEKLKDAASKFGIPVKNDMTERNDVLQTILSYIDSNKMDMVILGSRSRVGSDRFTLGSIALGTCKSAKCPVIIIK